MRISAEARSAVANVKLSVTRLFNGGNDNPVRSRMLFTVIQGFLGDPLKRVFLFIRKLQLILRFTNGFQADKSGVAFDRRIQPFR